MNLFLQKKPGQDLPCENLKKKKNEFEQTEDQEPEKKYNQTYKFIKHIYLKTRYLKRN